MIEEITAIDFLVTEINGVADSGNSLHDTVNLPFAIGSQPGIVKVIVPFTDPRAGISWLERTFGAVATLVVPPESDQPLRHAG